MNRSVFISQEQQHWFQFHGIVSGFDANPSGYDGLRKFKFLAARTGVYTGCECFEIMRITTKSMLTLSGPTRQMVLII